MALETASVLAPAPAMVLGKKIPASAAAIHQAMREQIRSVFPDDDREAWQWISEDFETQEIDRPADTFKEWLEESYAGSDEFSQLLVRRMFAIWQEMESSGFVANDKELYEHQKALFAWIALSTTTGVRDRIANLLVRSPYGSGKSLVAGLVGLAFRQAQEQMITDGTDPKMVPTGVLLGLRKEHMLQNALGEQFAVMQPPYTVERADVNVYWKNLSALFGKDFSEIFPKPKGLNHGFYALFNVSEDEEEQESPKERVADYMKTHINAEAWNALPTARRGEIREALEKLVAGEIIFIPDIYNVPQAERPLPREDASSDEAARYRGDSAFAFNETESYRVKATHKHLALNPSTHTTKPNTDNPAKMLIAYGTMVTRKPESIRIDIREEIMRTGRGLFIDEAGAFTPGSLGDSMSQLNGGNWPYMVGFTGGDRGIEGWERSPVLSVQKMIQLGLMKPIAFQGIGDAAKPPAQGTEEAWAEYRKRMFTDEKTATTLGLPQPHELDTVVVAPTKNVREYAHRLQVAHDEEGVPVKIWCFDPSSGDSRWSIVVNGFNAPKKKGDPKRILVAPPSQMSEALHLHAQCYDVLAVMSKYPVDQTRGRLGHIRNDETGKAREKARTYFRMQYLEGARGEAYVREVAEMMGIELKDENETWKALQCMIDLDAFGRDEKRRGLSTPELIPDTLAIQRRKKRRSQKPQWTPLKATSPFVIEQERKAAERQAKRDARDGILPLISLGGNEGTSEASKLPPMKLEEYTAKSEGTSVTLSVDANGMPRNIESLAQKLAPYGGSFAAKVRNSYHEGKRGQELAEIALHEYIRILGVIARRSGNSR